MVQSRSAALHDRLLKASLSLFVARGFRGTSLQDIAREVGCSKASLLYHFANKEAILAELMAPANAAMEALLTSLDAIPDDQVCAAAVEGLVDVALDFRDQLTLILSDAREVVSDAPQDQESGHGERLIHALTGRSRLPQDHLRGWVALGGILFAIAAGPQLERQEMRRLLIGSALQALAVPVRD